MKTDLSKKRNREKALVAQMIKFIAAQSTL